MVAGTLHPHRLDLKAFDNIFTDSRQGSSVVISGKSAFDLTDDSDATAPPLNESLLQTVREQPDVAAAEGSVNGEAQIIDDRQQGDRLRRGAEPRLLHRKRRQPLQSTLTRRGLSGRRATRWLSTARPPTRRASWSGTPSASRAAGRSSSCDLGDREVRRRSPRSEGRRSQASTFRPRSGSSTCRGSSTRSPWPRRPESPTSSSLKRSGHPAANTQVRTADEQAQNDAKDTNSFIKLHAHVPALIRRHRAFRRRVRDRELPLDHDRAADASWPRSERSERPAGRS